MPDWQSFPISATPVTWFLFTIFIALGIQQQTKDCPLRPSGYVAGAGPKQTGPQKCRYTDGRLRSLGIRKRSTSQGNSPTAYSAHPAQLYTLQPTSDIEDGIPKIFDRPTEGHDAWADVDDFRRRSGTGSDFARGLQTSDLLMIKARTLCVMVCTMNAGARTLQLLDV